MDPILIDSPAHARARTRLGEAVGAGHPVVLLLGQSAEAIGPMLDAVTRDLSLSGRPAHRVRADRFRPADLTQADARIVVAVDRADLLPRPALLAIDQHLRDNQPTQLLLAALPIFRALTAMPGLMTLHFAPLVVALPRPAPAPGIAESRPLAALLDRPLAMLAGAVALAAIAGIVAAPLDWAPAAQVGAPPTLPPLETQQPATLPGQSGVIVDQIDPDDLLAPRVIRARAGESLRAAYARVYRGIDAPPFAAVRALNPRPPVAGAPLTFPAPPEGWPAQ